MAALAVGTMPRAADAAAPPPECGNEPVAERLEVPGIDNAYRLSPRLLSGGQPKGDQGFASLRRLGVRTVLSVDGARTDVDAARRHGMRYAHLPVGYDRIDDAQALRIVEAIQALPGPVFVHCHHGRHRGPAAAALAGRATEGWDRERALAWMAQAGTSPHYRGLYDCVRRFEPPSPARRARVAAEFPERAAVPPMIEMMVQIDQRWEHLGAIREAGWTAPPDHPDLDPAHEAKLLFEDLRELARTEDMQRRGAGFERELRASASAAGRLEAALRSRPHYRSAPVEPPDATAPTRLESAFRAVAESCTRCHERFRDG